MALFAGAGGGILGGLLLGWETICAVEINAFCARRLMQRQNEGHLPPFPVWDDVSTFDGRPWRGRVDVVSGGFPCQDISSANPNAKGVEAGLKSGLWRHMARSIGEARPAHAFVENSPMLTVRGLGIVLRDLAEMGYHAKWGVFYASDAIWLGGIPAFDHERARCFITASDSDRVRGIQSEGIIQNERQWIGDGDETVADADRTRRERFWRSAKSISTNTKQSNASGSDWWSREPDVERMANGVAARVERSRAIGNGQVPAVVKLAWDTLTQ